MQAKAQAEATAKTEEAEARAKREAKANAENDAKVRAQKEAEQKAAAQAKQEAERTVVSKAQKESDDKASQARADNEAAMSSVQAQVQPRAALAHAAVYVGLVPDQSVAQAKNVEEARQWIKDWRTKGASSAAKQPASSSNNSPQAPFWPGFKLPWQQQAAASQNGSGADKVRAGSHDDGLLRKTCSMVDNRVGGAG